MAPAHKEFLFLIRVRHEAACFHAAAATAQREKQETAAEKAAEPAAGMNPEKRVKTAKTMRMCLRIEWWAGSKGRKPLSAYRQVVFCIFPLPALLFRKSESDETRPQWKGAREREVREGEALEGGMGTRKSSRVERAKRNDERGARNSTRAGATAQATPQAQARASKAEGQKKETIKKTATRCFAVSVYSFKSIHLFHIPGRSSHFQLLRHCSFSCCPCFFSFTFSSMA